MKKCTKCDTEKEDDNFSRMRSAWDGKQKHCKDCMRAYQKRWQIETAYGLTKEGLEELQQNQQGCCAICKKQKKKLFIDHCHKSGKVRGLLCLKCNSGLGFFQDKIKVLYSAIEYLTLKNDNYV